MKLFWILAMILGFVSSQSTISGGASSSESDSDSSSSSSSESVEIEVIEIEGSGASLENLNLKLINLGILPGPSDNRKKRQLPSAFDIRK